MSSQSCLDLSGEGLRSMDGIELSPTLEDLCLMHNRIEVIQWLEPLTELQVRTVFCRACSRKYSSDGCARQAAENRMACRALVRSRLWVAWSLRAGR